MKKRLLSFLLCLAMALSLLAVPAIATEDAEIARAKALGIADSFSNETVTAKEFFTMLNKVVELTDKTKLSTFKKLFPAARASNIEMTRFDGMVAVLAAAEVLGVDESNYDPWSVYGGVPSCNAVWNDALYGGA